MGQGLDKFFGQPLDFWFWTIFEQHFGWWLELFFDCFLWTGFGLSKFGRSVHHHHFPRKVLIPTVSLSIAINWDPKGIPGRWLRTGNALLVLCHTKRRVCTCSSNSGLDKLFWVHVSFSLNRSMEVQRLKWNLVPEIFLGN